MKLSHKERVNRMLGGRDVDRPAISMWRHFYDRENARKDIVDVMIEFQRKYDWDFMKINTRASYHIEDWGAKFVFSDNPLKRPQRLDFPIKNEHDWEKIKKLDSRNGALGETLGAVYDLVAKIGGEIYCLPTIFSPLSIAADLAENDSRFVEILHDGPEELKTALRDITATFVDFVRELMKTRAAGIFFATTEWASRDLLTEEEYLEFGQPYDLEVLKHAQSGIFNVIHVCGKNNMLPLFKNYPAHVLSWNPFDEGNLSIHQAAQIFEKTLLTGVDHLQTMAKGSPANVKKQIEDSLRDASTSKLMIGPGCALKLGTPDENIKAAIVTVEGWKYE
jgi:uroporphyrinogen decarboxylase